MIDEPARERIRRAIEDSARQDDEDERAKQRNAGVAIAVLAVVVVGLLIAIVTGAMPRP
jgi:F0F1-type ATP synthase assembly protein I